MTSESIRDVLLVQEGKYKRIENFQTCCLEVSFRGLFLEKMHTALYLFCFHMSYFIFWNQKREVRKKKSLNTLSLAANILSFQKVDVTKYRSNKCTSGTKIVQKQVELVCQIYQRLCNLSISFVAK